jgi:phenylpyruvate tautomerase PptA (4-oxalocrotonate tautomerase family)
MPFIRISMLKGRPPEEIRSIADGVHAALVDVYAVPEDDRFQIVEQLEPDALLYSKTYLGIERSDHLVIVHVTASNWRDTAAKQALYRAIADRLAVNPGVRGEDVLIVITSNERPDWSFGNGIASYAPEPG